MLDAKIGLPGYSSAGISVGLTLPCTAAEVDDAYDKAKAWAERRLADEVRKIKDSAGE